jgi:polar amino acid transport system permease protein
MAGNKQMTEFMSNLLFISKGLALTLELLLGGLSMGLCLGTLLAILRYQGIAASVITRLISIMRGTPLLLQLSVVYFITPSLVGIKLDILTTGIITFGLNSSAYIAEIIRSGIESLPKGQFEAAKTLEIPCFYRWKDILLPQVMRAVFPALVSEVIALLKETSLIATLGGMDIMRASQTLAAAEFTYFMPLCIAGAYYYGLVLLIESLGKMAEKRNVYAYH